MRYSLTVHSTIIAFLSVIGHLKKRSITFETDIWFHCSIELFVWNSLILSSIWLGSRCLSFHVLLQLFGATPCFKTPPDIYQMQIDTGMKPFRNLILSFQAASSRALLILQNFKIEYSIQPSIASYIVDPINIDALRYDAALWLSMASDTALTTYFNIFIRTFTNFSNFEDSAWDLKLRSFKLLNSESKLPYALW